MGRLCSCPIGRLSEGRRLRGWATAVALLCFDWVPSALADPIRGEPGVEDGMDLVKVRLPVTLRRPDLEGVCPWRYGVEIICGRAFSSQGFLG